MNPTATATHLHFSNTHKHTMGLKSFFNSIASGWEDWRVLLAARDDDDDDYNFASGARRGVDYNFPSGARRGAESNDDCDNYDDDDHSSYRGRTPSQSS